MSYIDAVAEGLKWRIANPAASREEIVARAESFASAWEDNEGRDLFYGFLAGVRRAD